MDMKKLTAFILSVSLMMPGLNAYADDEAAKLKNGWFRRTSSGEMTYFIDDELVTGLTEINGKIYLFDENGALTANTWYEDENGDRYYFGEKGRALTGRQIIDGTEYTFDKYGKYECVHKNTNYVRISDNIYTYDEMTEDIAKLEKKYPDICSVSIIGTTADSRNIYDIVLGNPDAEKQIVISASCHAREYMTSLLVMEQLELCLNGMYTEEYEDISYKELFNDCAVHIIPMINPDGVTISRFGKDGINDEELRRSISEMYKNAVKWGYTDYSEDYYYKRWKANARGVDLNNNFDGNWESMKTLNGPVGWGYKGESPESENETIAVTQLIRSLSNPVTAVSYHATGSVLWWDYGQTGEFREICEKQRDVVTGLTGYRANPYDASSAGGLSDWIIAEFDESIVPQTVEIGVDVAPLKASEFNNIWKKNKYIIPALAYLYYEPDSTDDIADTEDTETTDTDDSDVLDLFDELYGTDEAEVSED